MVVKLKCTDRSSGAGFVTVGPTTTMVGPSAAGGNGAMQRAGTSTGRVVGIVEEATATGEQPREPLCWIVSSVVPVLESDQVWLREPPNGGLGPEGQLLDTTESQRATPFAAFAQM